MKFSVVLAFLFLFSSISFADMAPFGTHQVFTCIKFDNLDQFPNTYLILRESLGPENTRDAYIIRQNECLDEGYKLSEYTIYSAPKEYVDSVGVDSVDFENENMQVVFSSLNPSHYYTDENILHKNITYSIVETDDYFTLQKTSENITYQPSLFDTIKCFFIELFGGTC